MDSLRWFDFSPAEVFPLLIALFIVWGFIHMMNGDHPVEWWHFVSAYNERTGQERGDINSVGMAAGVVVCLFVPLWIVYVRSDINPWILAVCLIYLGGVKMFAAWLRSLADRKFVGTPPPPLPPPPATETTVTTTTATETKTGGQV